jgi:hypothetical protein
VSSNLTTPAMEQDKGRMMDGVLCILCGTRKPSLVILWLHIGAVHG